MEYLLTLSFAVASCLVGVAITWQALASRHKQDFEGLERGMTDELRARLETYDELKDRVVAILHSVGQRERNFIGRLNVQRANICSLQEMLTTREEASAGNINDDLERDFQLALEPIEAAFSNEELVDLPMGTEDMSFLVDELEFQTESIGENYKVALDDSATAIANLAARAIELEPLADSLSRREYELQGLKRLQEELAVTNESQARLMRQCIEEFQPVMESLSRQEELVERWRNMLSEAESASSEHVTELEFRISELEPQAARLTESENELFNLQSQLMAAGEEMAKWQQMFESVSADCSKLEDQLGRVFESVEAKQLELNKKKEELGLCDAEIEDMRLAEDEAREEIGYLTTRLDELMPLEDRVATLNNELSTKEMECKDTASELEGLSSDFDSQTRDIEIMESDIGQLKEQLERASDRSSASEEQVKELENQLQKSAQRLSQVAGRLEVSLASCQELQDELTCKSASLESAERECQKISGEFVSVQAELNQALEMIDSQLEEAGRERGALECEKSQLQDVLDQVESSKFDLEAELAQSVDEAATKGQRIEELQESLVMVSGDASINRDAMLAKMSTVQEAHNMLEAMRPMFEGLQEKLNETEHES
ncbi:MAG: chromosome segregation ATPase [Planctomycetota bacterium]|jgi:chromosome segregation ATPase